MGLTLFHIASFLLSQIFGFTPPDATITFMLLTIAALSYVSFAIATKDFTPDFKQMFFIFAAIGINLLLLLYVFPQLRPDLFAASTLDLSQTIASVLP